MPGLFIRSGKFSDKMDLTIRMPIFSNFKQHHAICLKLGDRFFTSLTMIRLQAKACICSKIKENLPLHCRKYSAFVIAFQEQSLSHKETPLVIRIVNFAIELLMFQNRLLNSSHYISDIKLPCFFI